MGSYTRRSLSSVILWLTVVGLSCDKAIGLWYNAWRMPNLHAPEVSCIAEGKAHKKYEFGNKVSVASFSGSDVVVITSFVGNPHDGKTLATALDAVARWTGQRYARVLVDKGYRGHGQVGGSAVIIPGKKVHASAYTLRRHISAVQR
jgi:hypothetical protein